MTIDQFLAQQGIIYRRAREWQNRFNGMADSAAFMGCPSEAQKLRAIGERAWVVAERLVDNVFERVA